MGAAQHRSTQSLAGPGPPPAHSELAGTFSDQRIYMYLLSAESSTLEGLRTLKVTESPSLHPQSIPDLKKKVRASADPAPAKHLEPLRSLFRTNDSAESSTIEGPRTLKVTESPSLHLRSITDLKKKKVRASAEPAAAKKLY